MNTLTESAAETTGVAQERPARRGPRFGLTLTQRLSLVFSVLLLACCGASAWLQVRSNDMHEKEVIQDLSRGLAAHIARNAVLMDADGLKPEALRQLFGQLMVVNPSVEVYLLDGQGHVVGHDAPAGRLQREQVDLQPVRRLLAGGALPILGDDPRSATGRKVFSAAPLRSGGYIYVVLLGETHDELAARVSASSVLRTTLWSMALVAALGLVAGLVAFGLITRPLRRLTEAMRRFNADADPETAPAAQPGLLRASAAGSRDEIAALEAAFAQMAGRIAEQWRALTKQDQERRELVANISHDLRTPLTSLQGYLETLSLKADTLGDAERRRYLAIALAQSVKVGRLAQSLFELARLEHGIVQPALEAFLAGGPAAGRVPEIRAAGRGAPGAVARRHPAAAARGDGGPRHDRARADQPAGQRHPPHARAWRRRCRPCRGRRQGVGHGQRHRPRHRAGLARAFVPARLQRGRAPRRRAGAADRAAHAAAAPQPDPPARARRRGRGIPLRAAGGRALSWIAAAGADWAGSRWSGNRPRRRACRTRGSPASRPRCPA